MRYIRILLNCAAFAGLLLLCRPAAQAAPLYSDDGVFSVDLPGSWTQDEGDGRSVVLLATSGEKKLRISRLNPAGELSEEKIKTGLRMHQERMAKKGVQASRVYSFKQADGGKIYFTQYEEGGARFQISYFNFAGQAYNMVTMHLADAEFQAVPKTIAPQDKAAQGAPEPAAAGAAAPTPPEQAGAQGSSLPPPPEGGGSAEGLGAPPAEAANGAEGAPASPKELPPLPKRQVGGALSLFLVLALVSAAVLGYRFLAKRETAAPAPPPPPGSVLPFRAEKIYRAFPLVFEVTDASGQRYRAVSPRTPMLLLGSGIIIYFLLKVTIQGLDFAGLDPRSVPVPVLQGLSLLMQLSNLLIAIGALLFLFFRKKLKIYDPSGELMLDITQKRMTFASLYFFLRDKDGDEVGGLRRKGWALIRRHWELLDHEGNVVANIREDSAGRALARKFLGHLWGLLRTNYIIYGETGEIGLMKREWSVWNRYTVDLAPTAKVDPRLAMAAAVMIDVVDPDRWYPWYG